MNMYSQIKNHTRALCVTVLCGIICIITTPAAVRAASPEQTATAFISSDLYVGADNTISVTEVIEIHQVELLQPPVITRRFGTTETDSLGNTMKRHIVFHDVQVDERAAEWTLTTLPNDVLELQIQADGAKAAAGVRTYTLSYTVDDGILFGEQSDQLFWEVTGSHWNIPIPWSRIVVHTPKTLPAKNIKIQLRTGTAEEADTAAIFDANENILTGITNRTLAPGESFSVLLTLPKGHVAEPGWIAGVWWILRDNKNLILYLGTLVALFIYYWLAWFFFGRDPEPKTVVAQYEPPLGLSAAAVAYVRYIGPEKRGLTAVLLSLAQKGYITITERDYDHVLTRTSKVTDGKTTPEESAALIALFVFSDAMPVSTTDPSVMPRVQSALADSLEAQFRNQYFRRNTGFILFGIFLSWIFVEVLDAYTVPGYGMWTWFVLLVITNVAFGLVLPARTPAGKRLLEQIYGFKDFLQTTMQDRLRFHHGAGTDLQHIDPLLPYAVALGVSNTGVEHFARNVLDTPPGNKASRQNVVQSIQLLLDSALWRADIRTVLRQVWKKVRRLRSK